MREANFSKILSHDYDQIWPNMITRKIDIIFDSKLYEKIIIQRFKFYYEKIKDNKVNISKNVPEIISRIMQDKDFEKYLLPLYNNNLRKLIIELLILYSDKEKKVIYDEKEFLYIYEKNRYGAMGNIIFGITRLLYEDNFLKAFTKINLHSTDYPNGYCLPMRVILTFILNSIDNNGHNHNINFFFKNFLPLSEILNHLSKIYSPSIILDSISQAFLMDKNNWVNLITIYHKDVQDINCFDKDKLILKEYSEFLRRPQDYNKKEKENIMKEYNRLQIEHRNINIVLNSSTFAYLKHLNTHFEYFSFISHICSKTW